MIQQRTTLLQLVRKQFIFTCILLVRSLDIQIDSSFNHKRQQFSPAKPLAKYYSINEDEFVIKPYGPSSSLQRTKTPEVSNRNHQAHHPSRYAPKQLSS